MANFDYRGKVKVYIGEMSRTAEIECVRDILAVVEAMGEDGVLQDADVIAHVSNHAPIAIAVGERVYRREAVTVEQEPGITFEIPFPLTGKAILDMPRSFMDAWTNALLMENAATFERLKKSPTPQTSGPESGSGS